jgi:tetrahydromethanopterin S-methyltransferase subunit E
VDGCTGIVNLAGVESDEPQEHMGSHRPSPLWRHHIIGALGEPITYELLNPVTFNPLLAVIQAGMIIIPLVMMVFAIQEWRRRRSESKQRENPTMADASVLRRL